MDQKADAARAWAKTMTDEGKIQKKREEEALVFAALVEAGLSEATEYPKPQNTRRLFDLTECFPTVAHTLMNWGVLQEMAAAKEREAKNVAELEEQRRIAKEKEDVIRARKMKRAQEQAVIDYLEHAVEEPISAWRAKMLQAKNERFFSFLRKQLFLPNSHQAKHCHK